MHTVYKTPAVTATTRPTRDLDADLLVVPVVENDALSDEPDLDPASGGGPAPPEGGVHFRAKRTNSSSPHYWATDGRRAVRSGLA